MFDALTAAAEKVIAREFPDAETVVSWQIPREKGRGDASTTVALSLAKKIGKKPQDVAAILVKELSALPEVEMAEVAGQGYVNVTLKPAALIAELEQTRTAHTKRVKVQAKESKPVLIDYSAPNIAKPLGVHHILSTVIGQALANVYRSEGFAVVSINHLGDWGTQFGKLAVAMERFGKGKTVAALGLDGLLDLYVKFHDEAETEATLEDEARAAFQKLEEGDPAMRTFWGEVVSVTMESIRHIYDRLHVSFDEVQGESFYEDKMEPVVTEGKTKKVFRLGEGGALIVEFPEEKNLTPFLILKGDGATLYSTRDLATIRYRIDRWHPQEILYVVDVAQSLHFAQLFETVKMLGWETPRLEHVVFGRMRFSDKSMSTRKGNILRLAEVLDEAVRRADKVIEEHRDSIQTDDRTALAEMMGIGAVVYGILSQNRKMDLVFDWDKMLSFEGNSAPYLQYTHARACSVLRKAEIKGQPQFPKVIPALTLTERVLLHTLAQLPDVMDEARDTKMPHKLANYLYQLCQDFNAFYNVEPILKAEGSAKELRLALTAQVASVLKTGAEVLTLRVPDRM